eukprot:6173229-Pleurochrysis_carterae.AAC.5
MAARGDSFVWSAEDGCFPLGGWPYNLGLGDYVCEVPAQLLCVRVRERAHCLGLSQSLCLRLRL